MDNYKSKSKETKDDKEYVKKIMSKKPTKESLKAAEEVEKLMEMLEDIEALKSYEAEYAKAKEEDKKAERAFMKKQNGKRLTEYLKADIRCGNIKARHKRTDKEEYERYFAEAEKVIDRKYWNREDLRSIKFLLEVGYVNSIEEAVAEHERHLAEKNKS